MNPILQVKLQFAKEKNNQRPGKRNLRSSASTTNEKIEKLIEDLKSVLRFYSNTDKVLDHIIVDANYNCIVAKSNRIKGVFKTPGKKPNDFVVGARFSDNKEGAENHIITYYVAEETIAETIKALEVVNRFISDQLGGKATYTNFKDEDNHINYDGYGLSATQIRDIVIDCSVLDSFSVPKITNVPEKENFLITFYKTELDVSNLMGKIGLEDNYTYPYTFYGENTIAVTKKLFDELCDKVPYLISMISSDLSRVPANMVLNQEKTDKIEIPKPQNEPVIGVIDTIYDNEVYFSDWVESIDYLDEIDYLHMSNNNKEHGTEVVSLIVDGPRMNPWLDDGCGRFRVRHFGVCEETISTSRLVKKIKKIVAENPDIHVWNLSLGTDEEVSMNFMSYDAAFLDELQAKSNVIFVVSGTNDNRVEQIDTLRIGSPADSLNSMVVNSVRRDGTPASYSRKGTVLSFFNKPDVSYYGGDYDERIVAYSPTAGQVDVYGTSFAAPWISRKLCYLIDIMGLPREIAKAMIIDASAGWEYKKTTYKKKELIGYGVVPIDIKQILETTNDEIRFVVYGTSESYKTANYAIPVPRDEDGKYPYIARATMCYFPKCTRSQGVDYTNRELSLTFGRINEKGSIEDINDNIQDQGDSPVDERRSRKEFRKWENTKFISKILKKNKPIKAYGERLWGMAITSKERLATKTEIGLNFGVIVTLKEVNGVNRIQDFMKACMLRGWIVNELDVQNKIKVYNTSQEEIVFE